MPGQDVVLASASAVWALQVSQAAGFSTEAIPRGWPLRAVAPGGCTAWPAVEGAVGAPCYVVIVPGIQSLALAPLPTRPPVPQSRGPSCDSPRMVTVTFDWVPSGSFLDPLVTGR